MVIEGMENPMAIVSVEVADMESGEPPREAVPKKTLWPIFRRAKSPVKPPHWRKDACQHSQLCRRQEGGGNRERMVAKTKKGGPAYLRAHKWKANSPRLRDPFMVHDSMSECP